MSNTPINASVFDRSESSTKQQNPIPEFVRFRSMFDPRHDYRYHDPRSVYVERFWMSVLGPSAILFLRLIIRELAATTTDDQSVVLEVSEISRRLGLGYKGGKNSALMRTIERCCTFGMANRIDTGVLDVRTAIPPMPDHLHNRLTKALREEIVMWSRTHDCHEIDDGQARSLARDILDMGHGLHESAERLMMLNVGLETSQKSVAWSWADSVSHPAAKSKPKAPEQT